MERIMELILLILAGITTFLCLGMLGGCLNKIKNVKRGDKK